MEFMNKRLIQLLLLLTLCLYSSCSSVKKHRYVPENGYVPTETVAIEIAKSIWLPIYGNDIYYKEPFVAELHKGVWIVKGTLRSGVKGGVPYIEIRRKDCKILSVTHGK